ncbi:sulfotransferase 1C2-like [Mercenaria mercenaria]|uniref:sulfotransferase 1C2-like n=1 Tax=Mercenaria mercenaria TaxID=6596 RepID=UPI00234F28BC|nr:sulfotransferase 1C2-like [Mercenaria mercenaria]
MDRSQKLKAKCQDDGSQNSEVRSIDVENMRGRRNCYDSSSLDENGHQFKSFDDVVWPMESLKIGVEQDRNEEGVVTVLEDEYGKQYKVVSFDDIVFPIRMLEMGTRKRLSNVKNFQYKDGDVLLCSFPKTGTHWTANLIHYLMYDGPLDALVSHSPCFIDLFDIESAGQREGRRIITSHLPPKRLPIEHFAKGGKTVLVFRNPKDTAVSQFHQFRRLKLFGDFRLSWNSYINYWIDGKVPMGSYFDYYKNWQKDIQDNPERDVLVVQYENLKMDSLNQIRRIQTYLELNHSDERLRAVLEKCSLGNLKADVESGKIKTALIDEAGKSILYRKGIIGDWKNHFTVTQNEKIEAVMKEKFKDSMFNYNT